MPYKKGLWLMPQTLSIYWLLGIPIGQRAVPVVLPLRLVPLGSESINLDESVVNMAEIIRHTENFRNFVLGDRHSERVCFWFVVIPKLQKLLLFS